jgi:ABC-type phosphate transport system substrate-binding protein
MRGRFTLPLFLLAALFWAGAAHAADLFVIANPSVEVDTLPLAQVARIYLLKRTTWPDGTRIVPVNRELGSPARSSFTRSVLKVDGATLADYWNQMHFKGWMPPVIQESGQAMLRFIQNVPGSIGYVRADSPPANVKILARVP